MLSSNISYCIDFKVKHVDKELKIYIYIYIYKNKIKK
jgi:hypothetical protein